MKLKLNVLADDGPEVGFGHIFRCMVLAQHFKRHGAAPVFLLNNNSPAVALVKSRGFIVKQYSSFDEIVDADLILVDSYLRNDSFFQCLASEDAFLMIIDDFGQREIACDAYFNHNFFAADLDFSKTRSKFYFLGEDYLLVSKRFFELGAQRIRGVDFPERILISFGGSEQGQFCWPLVSAIRSLDFDVPLTVVIPGVESKGIPAGAGDVIQLEHIDLSQAFEHHGLFVCGAGQASLEAFAARQPVIPVVIAANQQPNALALEQRGVRVVSDFDPASIAKICCEYLCVGLNNVANSQPKKDSKLSQAVKTLITYGRSNNP